MEHSRARYLVNSIRGSVLVQAATLLVAGLTNEARRCPTLRVRAVKAIASSQKTMADKQKGLGGMREAITITVLYLINCQAIELPKIRKIGVRRGGWNGVTNRM